MWANLSKKKLAILHLMTEGMSDEEIATQLKVTAPTVSESIRAIMLQIGAHSRTETAIRFLRRDMKSSSTETTCKASDGLDGVA